MSMSQKCFGALGVNMRTSGWTISGRKNPTFSVKDLWIIDPPILANWHDYPKWPTTCVVHLAACHDLSGLAPTLASFNAKVHCSSQCPVG